MSASPATLPCEGKVAGGKGAAKGAGDPVLPEPLERPRGRLTRISAVW